MEPFEVGDLVKVTDHWKEKRVWAGWGPIDSTFIVLAFNSTSFEVLVKIANSQSYPGPYVISREWLLPAQAFELAEPREEGVSPVDRKIRFLHRRQAFYLANKESLPSW